MLRPSSFARAPLPLLFAAFVSCAFSSTALAADPADDPRDVTTEPTLVEDAGVYVDPRLAPEPALDPYADERSTLDPADETALPGGEAREHDPSASGELSVPPFSVSVDCPDGTQERRGVAGDGPELWCADAQGRRHGPFVRLYPTGAPKLRGTYLEGRRHGVFHAWYESGRLESTGTFQRGLEHGVERLYYENGRMRAETTYHEGKKHGPHRAWHENGKLAVQGMFLGGERGSDWLYFDETGAPTSPPEDERDTSADVAVASMNAGPSLGAQLVAAAAGGVGATAGVALGAGAAFVVAQLGLLHAVDPNGWLPYLLVPPAFAAAGGALATLWFTRFPGALMAGVGSAFGIPSGALVGGILGGAFSGAFALGVMAFGASPEAALGLFLSGAAVGAVAGAAVGPGAFGALSGWLYASE